MTIYKPDFHSHISLVPGEIFVSENQENNSDPKLLHLINEKDVPGGNLPKKVLAEGFSGAANDVWRFFVGENFVCNKQNAWIGKPA